MPATLDSNLSVSAFVFGGKPGRVIEMATEGTVDVAVPDAIVAEVTARARHEVRLVRGARRWRRRDIGTIAAPTTATEVLDVVERDPDDNRVLECATASRPKFVVPGDNDLLALGSFGGIAIVTGASFLET